MQITYNSHDYLRSVSSISYFGNNGIPTCRYDCHACIPSRVTIIMSQRQPAVRRKVDKGRWINEGNVNRRNEGGLTKERWIVKRKADRQKEGGSGGSTKRRRIDKTKAGRRKEGGGQSRGGSVFLDDVRAASGRATCVSKTCLLYTSDAADE